jgi:hypothetical protein
MSELKVELKFDLVKTFATKTNDELEVELKQLSTAIESGRAKVTDDQSMFQSISAELKQRREVSSESFLEMKPRLATREDQLLADAEQLKTENKMFVLKITEMDGEQAKLVIEAQMARAAQREAEERLALVVKYNKQLEVQKEGEKR